MQVHSRICSACTRHARTEMDMVSCMKEIGLMVKSASFLYSPSYGRDREPTSVMTRNPSHSLLVISLRTYTNRILAYMIVVAVPIKYTDAFSSPPRRGCCLLSFADGRLAGTSPGASRVGASVLRRSTVKWCIAIDVLSYFFPISPWNGSGMSNNFQAEARNSNSYAWHHVHITPREHEQP